MVPDVVGITVGEAKNVLEAEGLYVLENYSEDNYYIEGVVKDEVPTIETGDDSASSLRNCAGS